MKKKYYAITTEMIFKKTVLVPIEEVENIEQAEEIVDAAVEDCTIMLLDEDAECNTCPSEYVDKNGMYELTEDQAECYQIIGNGNVNTRLKKNVILQDMDDFSGDELCEIGE